MALRRRVVHPGLLWVEFEFASVEVDGRLEAFTVATTSYAYLDCHDLAVDASGESFRDSVSTVTGNVGQPLLDSSGNFHQQLEAGMNHSLAPDTKVRQCCGFIRTGPELSQHLPVGPCLAGLEAAIHYGSKALLLAFR